MQRDDAIFGFRGFLKDKKCFDEQLLLAQKGDLNAQFRVAWAYTHGQGTVRDEAQAVLWYHKASEQEYAPAEYNLGVMYAYGQGVPPDQAQAVALYHKAANHGYPEAQYVLALRYAMGDLGVEQSYSIAIDWFIKAAVQGHDEAQYKLGMIYEDGQLGTIQNYNEAMVWYQQAASFKHTGAEYRLGVMCELGLGMSQNYDEAIAWYRKAADKNHADAQCRMGSMYKNGFGVKQDFKESIVWYRKAREQGNAQAEVEIQALERKILDMSQPKKKAWHFEGKPDSQQVQGYTMLDASEADIQKVLMCYEHHAIPGYNIRKVEVIYNPGMNRSFSLSMQALQARSRNNAFLPKWPQETEASWRTWRDRIHQQWQALAAPYQDDDYPAVKIMPLWHGTKPGVLESIFASGYANLATTDPGFYGKGLYSTHEAEYAYRVYSQGALILNWVATYSAYPVIKSDMPTLAEKANYGNYDAHFIPVVARDPSRTVYRATNPEETSEYTELVVFQQAQCLPRYLVTLQRVLLKEPLVPVIQRLFHIYNPSCKQYLFVSDSTKGDRHRKNNLVRAGSEVEEEKRERFKFESKASQTPGLFHIYNPSCKQYLFVSDSTKGSQNRQDNLVKAQAEVEEEKRERFKFEFRASQTQDGLFYIYNPNVNKYLFVFDGMGGKQHHQDNPIKACEMRGDERFKFELRMA